MPPMKEENPYGCLGQNQTLPADLFRKSSGPKREKVRAKLRNLFNAPTGAENIPRDQQLPRFLPFEERAEWRKANAVTLTSGAAFPSYQSNRSFITAMVSVARHLCLHRLMNMSRRRTPRKPTIATLTTSRHPHISVPASARSSHGQNPLFSLTRRMRSQIPNSCKLSASFESVRQALEF
ncbi:hypothetical protein HYQ44_019228 [Verticillium longisporum]|nr:hypothetical protein HYQ44_019228 [Verticillium longisporum]